MVKPASLHTPRHALGTVNSAQDQTRTAVTQAARSGFHPILCKYSVRDKACFDETCTYIHVRGTKRKPDYQPEHSQRPAPTIANQTNFRSSNKARDTRQNYPTRHNEDNYKRAYNPRQRTFSTSSNPASFPAIKNKYAPLLNTPDVTARTVTEPHEPEKEDTTSFLMKFIWRK